MKEVKEDVLKDIFARTLNVEKEIINDDFKYGEAPNWDSVNHMSLVAEIENEFGISLEMDDIIDMSSFKKAKEILEKYGIKIVEG